MNKKPGILLDHRLFSHVIDRPSPENPKRLRRLYHRLDAAMYRSRFSRIDANPADQEAVEAIHSRFYLDQIKKHDQSSDPFSYDCDTYVMPETLDCAFLAAGGCLQVAEAIMSGEIDSGFALIRPPGHHADPGRGMGFCVLNNVASLRCGWGRCMD